MSDQLVDLPFDPASGDIICCRNGERPGVTHFNIEQAHRHHSQTGMEWGSGGSGAADFALNILAVFLPPPAAPLPFPDNDADAAAWDRYLAIKADCVVLRDGSTVSQSVWLLHQPFKWAFVATLPEVGGTIPGQAIEAWIAEQGAALT